MSRFSTVYTLFCFAPSYFHRHRIQVWRMQNLVADGFYPHGKPEGYPRALTSEEDSGMPSDRFGSASLFFFSAAVNLRRIGRECYAVSTYFSVRARLTTTARLPPAKKDFSRKFGDRRVVLSDMVSLGVGWSTRSAVSWGSSFDVNIQERQRRIPTHGWF